MPSGRFGTGHRWTAWVALTAFVFTVLFASVGALAGGTAAAEELCASCGGCESGECGERDGQEPDSHHHCCTTSCLSHAAFTLPAAPSVATPAVATPLSAPVVRSLSPTSPEPPYRPPRV
jgi:hypothetical protein